MTLRSFSSSKNFLRLGAGLALGFAGCSGGGSSATVSGYQIQASSGGALTAAAGDMVKLSVVQTMSDGTTEPLATGATVAWSGPTTATAVDATLATDSTPNPIPTYPVATATAIFVANPVRSDRAADLDGVLFVLDPGTAGSGSVSVTATISGVTPGGTATASVAVTGPIPAGDATRGATLYGTAGANCAACHGATGDGSPQLADGGYEILNRTYDFPAPPLNAADPANLGADPGWDAPLLAMAARSDMDNGGIELRLPMPDFSTESVNGKLLSGQDFADIYAFLKSQNE